MRHDADLIERINRSEIYSDYEKAFEASTELPLRLRPIEFWKLPHQNRPHENPFCALLAQTNRTCASCLEFQQKAVDGAADHPFTTTCFAGLCDTAVPIKLGQRVVGFLITGQVALKKPSNAGFRSITQKILEWGSQIDLKRLEDAYFHSKVLNPKQYEAAIRLLEIFGKHLSLIANQLATQSAETEPPMIRRAKAYVAGHHADPLRLREIAAAMHVSTFYFCKMFKKATGMTFTDYLGRVRVEKAKNLLTNPHLRISEIAYSVGFQSLTHFNRVFRELTGQSPTNFRKNIVGSLGAGAMGRGGRPRSQPGWPQISENPGAAPTLSHSPTPTPTHTPTRTRTRTPVRQGMIRNEQNSFSTIRGEMIP